MKEGLRKQKMERLSSRVVTVPNTEWWTSTTLAVEATDMYPENIFTLT